MADAKKTTDGAAGTVPVAKRSAEDVVRAYIARGYTMRETDAGYWTWENAVADVNAADGATFKSDADKRSAERSAARLLRGAYPNGARLWANLIRDVADPVKGTPIVANMVRIVRFARENPTA